MKKVLYFDNAGTTNIFPECLDLIANTYKTSWYNPSSIYQKGEDVHKQLDTYKSNIAININAQSRDQIFFVSGSTEANNLIIRGLVEKNEIIIISKMEHPSIYQTAEDVSPSNTLYVNNNPKTGQIDCEHLEQLLFKNPDVKLVSIISLSNITGSKQNVKKISDICKKHSVWLHMDTTQQIGKFPFDVTDLDIDSCCASAHKFHGCKGIGFLYIKNPKDKRIHNTITGGSQQIIRAGTEALPQIAAMSCAMAKSLKVYEQNHNKIVSNRNYIMNNLMKKIPKTKLVGFNEKTNAPHIINIILPFCTYDLVKDLGKKGICLSVGSACSKGMPSKALSNAFKISEKEQKGSLRISLSYKHNLNDCKILIKNILKYYNDEIKNKK